MSATEQAGLIRSGKISSAELVHAHLKQIAYVNPKLNAAVEVLDALPAARAADDGMARGDEVGPLHGVPFSVKDSIEVGGTVCSAGTTGRAQAPPSARDAAVVANLRRAGAIPVARTNLPDLLFAFESDNLIYGRTNNPYDLQRTPGGSSGGEAALIAACGTPCGLGSDAAGSVRLPAAFCGISSLKPTSGRLPRTGHMPPAGGWLEALWQIGPMARHVRDLWTLMPILTVADGRDTTMRAVPLRDPAAVDLSALRVAFHTDNGFAKVHAEVADVVQKAASVLHGVGCKVFQDRPACLTNAFDLEMKIIGPDGGDSLRDFLQHMGSTEAHSLLKGWLEKLEPYRTDLAGFQRYWMQWDTYRREMAAFGRRYELIVAPAYTQPALLHGTSIYDENFRGFSYTMAYNVCGWPAAVVRCGTSKEVRDMPLAVQVIASPWREDIALAAAAVLESELGGWQMPGLDAS